MRHTSSALGKKMEDEAKVLKSLTHPNIIGYRHFKKGPDGAHTLVMEDGQKALYDIMEERNDQELGPFPAEDIEKVVRCIAGALDYIHTEKNLMHGDIKSTNILIVGDFESAKLSDFGVTLPVDSDGKVSDPSVDYMGTEAWSAIEVIKEETITTKADIFSFGLVIFPSESTGSVTPKSLSLADSKSPTIRMFVDLGCLPAHVRPVLPCTAARLTTQGAQTIQT